MKADYNIAPEDGWSLTGGPYEFYGPPDNCRGEIQIRKKTGSKLKLRSLPHKQADRKKKLLSCQLELNGSLREDGDHRLSARFRLDHTTPPGTYKRTIRCGDQEETVTLHVVAAPRFEFRPFDPLPSATAGQTISNRLLIRNRGNIPLELPDKTMVWFEEQDWTGRVMVHTLRESDAEEGHTRFLDRLHEKFRRSMMPLARVTFESDKSTVDPGEQLDCPIKVQVPEEFQKGRVYRGFIKLAGHKVWLELQSEGREKVAAS